MLISKMNNNSSEGTVSFAWYHSVDIRENLTHLGEKNSRPGAKIPIIIIIMKIF